MKRTVYQSSTTDYSKYPTLEMQRHAIRMQQELLQGIVEFLEKEILKLENLFEKLEGEDIS